MNKKIVHSVFEYIAATVPDRNAVEESGGASITYRDLNCRANIIASLLAERAICRDKLAAVLLPAGIGYTTAILGAMKAGGIFMPLDLALPRPRLHHILSHTTPAVIVTNEASVADLIDMLGEFGLAESTRMLVMEMEPHPHPNPPPEGEGIKFTDLNFVNGHWLRTPSPITSDGSNLPLISEPDDSCYVIYTSGSTGIPKFIEGWHKGLAHYCHWQATEFGLNDTSKISQMAPVTFEASLKDFFVALTCGATLCIPSPDVKENPARLIEWIESSEITLFQTVPSYLRLVAREVLAQGGNNRFPAMKLLFQSGDTLYGKDVNQWRQAAGEHVELVNLYGPAEVTLLKSFHRIPPGELKPNEIVPIGKPISNTVILILNGNTLCSPGKIGEICVKSPFIVKGYYRSPELTAEKFVQNPLNTESRDIIYRTGDLGRYRADMTIEFIGRMDSQVKVHGNRIELAEIENVLLSCPQINQVVIVPHRTDEMENILACYYTEQEPVTQAELRELILSRLPDYMVPAYFIRMESLPLSLNGKVDRKALPKPEEMVITSYDEPITATEKGLAEIWCEVLGLGRVGACNPFIEIGGDSLKAIRVIARIYKLFSVEVSVRDFFACPTIRELARFIDDGRKTTYLTIPVVPDADAYELSHAQRRLWLIDQLEPESPAYNIASSFLIEGQFAADAFIEAMQSLHDRHESLRTTFFMHDGVPRQRVATYSVPSITILDISDESDVEQKARSRFRLEASRPFNLAAGPLYRCTLLKTGDGNYVFIFVIHHIISDVWSLGVMVAELSQIYNARVTGSLPELPILSIQYRDFAAWQNKVLAADEIQSDRAYWLEKLGGTLPLLDLPTDFPRPLVKTYAGASLHFHLEKHLSDQLRAIASAEEASLFALLISLVRTLVYRYTGQEDLVIGSPVAGRTHPDLEPQIGFFINTLALRDQVDPEEPFTSLLAKVMSTNTDAFDHQGYPFDHLVEELRVTRDVSRSPVFDLMVVLQNTGQVSFALHGTTVREFEQLENVSKFDLDFVFQEQDEVIEVVVEYNCDLFLAERIRKIFGHFVRLAEGVALNPSSRICDLPLLCEEEYRLLTETFNRKNEAEADQYAHGFIHQLFEEQARRTPDAIALIHNDQSISYDEVNRRANQIAHYLVDLGVAGDSLVAICLERSMEMIVALLGILKSGAAYVPLDSGYPHDRLAFMLEDSGARILITEEKLRYRLPQIAEQTLSLDTDKAVIDTFPVGGLNRHVAPDHLAYLIYTSGSTGKPKGVAIEHHSPAAFLAWARTVWSPEEVSGVLAGTSICFDLSIFEMFVTLSLGGTVIVAENVLELPNIAARNRVTLVNTVPSAIDALLRQDALPASVRVVNLAGEPLTTELADRVYGVPTVQKVYDLYGPSEDTTYSTIKLRIPGESPSIGRPISWTQLYILDRHLQPTPLGVPGELHIGGSGLARCYLNRPELTAEKFIPDPFSATQGSRLYKTGDLARYRQDGNVEYLGRLDHQVKIRGFRIELGEIETALNTHPAIREAVVIARADMYGNQRLVAYIVLSYSEASNASPAAGELITFLKASLPDFMMPSAMVFLPAIPLTPNGKLDRKALPDPDSPEAVTPGTGTDYLPPRSDLEKIMAEVWEGVLGKGSVGVNDNYFALGGDSIRAIQVGSRLQQQGLKMDMLDIFQFPTVAALAGRVTKLKRIADQGVVSGLIPLSPAQQWFFEQHRQGLHHFNQAILLGSLERLDEKQLRIVLESLISHHDALRICFSATSFGWQQENRVDVPPPRCEVVDLTENTNPEAALERHAATVQSGFDLGAPPLVSAVLYRLPDADRLLLVIHHLVVDGVSWRILAEDLLLGFRQLTLGEPLTFPRKSDSFKIWSEHLRDYAVREQLLREATYWQGIALKDIEPLPLLLLEGGETAAPAEIQVTLTADETAVMLHQANRAYNTDTADLLLTALAFTLEEWTGSRSNLITLEGHGRENIGEELDISRTVGWFTSIYPHLLELPDRADPGYRLRVIKEGIRAVPNHGCGYGVLRWLTPDHLKQGIVLPALPPVCFNYLGTFDADFGDGPFFPAEEAYGETVGAEIGTPFALEYTCSVMAGVLAVTVSYDMERIAAAAAVRLADGFLQHLRTLISHCCSQEEGGITPSDISYDGLDIDELDALLEGLEE